MEVNNNLLVIDPLVVIEKSSSSLKSNDLFLHYLPGLPVDFRCFSEIREDPDEFDTYQKGKEREFEHRGQVCHCFGSKENRIKSEGLSSSNLSLFLGHKAPLQFRDCLLSHRHRAKLPEILGRGL